MKKEILYISSLCSDKVTENIFNTSTDKSGLSIQKFHKLIVFGLAAVNLNTVKLLVSLPITHKINKRKIWFLKKERDFNSDISYVPTINLPLVKNVVDFLYTFFKVLFWTTSKNNKKYVIVDVLKLSPVVGAFLACKIRRIHIVTIVTDMPGIDVFQDTIKRKIKTFLIKSFLINFDGYILISKFMNSIVNPKQKPSMVMEGLVDLTMKEFDILRSTQKNIVYTGGLYERYGLKKLINAFMKINDKDLKLQFYGEGPLVPEILSYSKEDGRVMYMGVVLNKEMVKRQVEAFLLVNPRPTNEELTKYSFPGKNMEYMVSGTPTLTTKLLGMPDDYLPYVFLIKDETIEGIGQSIENILELSEEEFNKIGFNAKKFVLENKNNFVQAKRIVNFLNKI